MNILTYSEIENTPYTKIIISKTCPYHSHTFFEFSICLDGTYTNIINGVKINVIRGTVLLLRPQDSHYFINGEKHTHRDVYIVPEKMQALCNAIDANLYEKLSTEPLIINFNLPEFDLKLLEGKLNFFNYTDNKTLLTLNAAHASVITDILYLWQQYFFENASQYPSWLYKLINNLKREEFFLKSIEEIAESTHYSHGYVCREFKKHIGESLLQYIIERKLSYAQALLTNNETSVASVADKLNYSSPTNFINAFKKQFGVSPAQWRKNLKAPKNM